MAEPQVLIVRAPGTNCDQETEFAFRQAGARVDSWHINRLLADPEQGKKYQILCIPGGFSYGDDIAAGRILGNQFRLHLRELSEEFREKQKLVLGICNGFQVLLKSGILLSDVDGIPPATLAWNQCGRFEDRWVNLKVSDNQCPFLTGIEEMYLPVAHAEGNFCVNRSETIDQLKSGQQDVLRYATPDGDDQDVAYPYNPNGADDNLAGICDSTGRVFGLMPHPERFVDATHHPRWTREPERAGQIDGLAIFKNAVNFFE